MDKKRLNIGCGKDIKRGWINLDSAAIPGVDVVHDVERLPLPFSDESIDEIFCQDVLEHVEYIPILKDLHRILKKDGTVTIRVPHFTSRNNFIDPTHKKLFSVATFEMFVQNSSFSKSRDREYYFDFHFSRAVSPLITFDHSSRFFFLNRLMEPLVNINGRTRSLYESTGWCYLFPAQNIEIILVK